VSCRTPIRSSVRTDRINQIDILRGLAALSVLYSHLWGYAEPITARSSFWLHDLGWGLAKTIKAVWPQGWTHPGVLLFIVLSGFCIHLPYAGKNQSWDRESLRYFFRRRFLRIYPVLCFALIFGLIATSYASSDNPWLCVSLSHWRWWQSGAQMAGLPGFFPLEEPIGNTILSTVVSEMGLYAIYPLLLGMTRSLGWGWLLAGLFPVTLAARALTHFDWFGSWPLISIWGFLFFWWLGALSAEWRARRRELTAKVFWLTWLLVSAVFILGNTLFFTRIIGPLFGPLFASIVALLLLHINYVNIPPRGFSWLEWIGVRSYSLYVCHWPTLGLTFIILTATRATSPLVLIGVPIVAVVLATLLFHRTIEAPFQRLAKTLNRPSARVA
jgi:peptidoglycan/LPS O-acetylase OafA/YrhL